MTREQATKELGELEPRERILWAGCNAKLAERDAFERLWMDEYQKLQCQWTPVYGRVQQLKTFLEIDTKS